MNLTITPKILYTGNSAGHSNSLDRRSFDKNSPVYKYNLEADTVSFTAARKKTYTSTVADSVEEAHERKMRVLNQMAVVYLDVLDSVASELNKNGDVSVQFDRKYCEKSPVKSAASYTSKVKRSKSFDVADVIRATLYCNNPYDLRVLNKIVKSMEDRGYVVAPTQIKLVDGRLTQIDVPDLDLRLEDIKNNSNMKFLDPKFKECLGRPQKSGYEDIQIRFVKEADLFDKKKSPTPHELIILFGPNYAKAKSDESSYVYNHLRKFGELNMKFDKSKVGSHSFRAARYIELIEQMFRGKVSQKLFINAKNKDYYNIDETLPVTFNEDDQKLFDSYFGGLHERLSSCYSEKRKVLREKSVKLKQQAKTAEESANERELGLLKEKISTLRAQLADLKESESDDHETLAEIQEGLNETIKRYFKSKKSS